MSEILTQFTDIFRWTFWNTFMSTVTVMRTLKTRIYSWACQPITMMAKCTCWITDCLRSTGIVMEGTRNIAVICERLTTGQSNTPQETRTSEVTRGDALPSSLSPCLRAFAYLEYPIKFIEYFLNTPECYILYYSR